MKLIYCLFFLFIAPPVLKAQSSDEREVRQVLADQLKYWNEGNLEKFMLGYWNNDSLMFVGQSGITYGYTNTLNKYKKSYGDTALMGKLRFDIIKVMRLSPDYYHVTGAWFLSRTVGDIGGHFTLLFRKIKGSWKIICDHSS